MENGRPSHYTYSSLPPPPPPKKKRQTTPTPTIPAERKSMSYVKPNNAYHIHIDVKECLKSRTNDIKSKHIIMNHDAIHGYQFTSVNVKAHHISYQYHGTIFHRHVLQATLVLGLYTTCKTIKRWDGSQEKKLLHWACPSFHVCR